MLLQFRVPITATSINIIYLFFTEFQISGKWKTTIKTEQKVIKLDGMVHRFFHWFDNICSDTHWIEFCLAVFPSLVGNTMIQRIISMMRNMIATGRVWIMRIYYVLDIWIQTQSPHPYSIPKSNETQIFGYRVQVSGKIRYTNQYPIVYLFNLLILIYSC